VEDQAGVRRHDERLLVAAVRATKQRFEYGFSHTEIYATFCTHALVEGATERVRP
jgi:hypothetical protein